MQKDFETFLIFKKQNAAQWRHLYKSIVNYFFCSLAHASFNVTVRLKTSRW